MTAPTLPAVPPFESAELTAAIQATPGMLAIVHASADGMVLAHAGDMRGEDSTGLAAIATGLYSLAQASGRYLPGGPGVDFLSIIYAPGELVVIGAQGSVLIGLSDGEDDTSPMSEALSRLAERSAPSRI